LRCKKETKPPGARETGAALFCLLSADHGGTTMATKDGEADKHEEARKKAEEALAAYAEGDKAKGDRLAEEAQKLDRSAVIEVIEEIDEDEAARSGPKTD
jgi:hypothetical protein